MAAENRRLSNTLKKIVRDRYLLLLLLPVVVHYIIFCYIPIYGITLAFKDFQLAKGILGSPWVGFKYFSEFFNSIYFGRLLRNTLLINIYSLIFGFPIPIIFALALNEINTGFFKRFVQTVSYFPNFISTVIVVSMITAFLNPVDGIGMKIAQMFGYSQANMLADASLFRTIYVFSGVWQSFGWSSIIYLAAMASIDPTLYESAIIDGATRLKRALHITIPCIKTTIIIILILNLGGLLSIGTEKIVLMLSPGVYETGDVISSYTYRLGIQGAKYSFATAVGFFNSTVNFIILIIANTISRRISETSLW